MSDNGQNKFYDVVQPSTYMKGDKEVTRWNRVGIAFPKYDKESGVLIGFSLRFNSSPPFPPFLMVAERKEREKQETKKPELNLEDDPTENKPEDGPPF